MTSDSETPRTVASSLSGSTWTLSAVAGGLVAMMLFRSAALIDRTWLADLPGWITFNATFVAPLLFILAYPLITRRQPLPNTFQLPTAKRLAKELAIAIPLVLFGSILANANGPFLGVVRDPAAKTCVIADVTPGSPAAKAGFLVGDTITRVDDHPIENFNSLFDTLKAYYTAGDTIAIIVTRGDETLQIEVTLAPRSTVPDDQ